MRSDFSAAMRRALQLTRTENVIEATRVIQRALGGGKAAPPADAPPESARLLTSPGTGIADTARAAAAAVANGDGARGLSGAAALRTRKAAARRGA